MWYLCLMDYYSAIREDERLPFAPTQMDLENITLREISQMKNIRNHLMSLICGI